MLPVVILCGGLATRMRPLTTDLPKSLIPIRGEPFILHQLRLLKQQGITNVLLCVGFLGEMIEALMDDTAALDMQVTYAYEGEQLLGTGGALVNAYQQLPERFFMLYGDSYLPCDFAAVQNAFMASQKAGLMTVYHNQDRFDSSNVVFKNGEIKIYDKVNKVAQMHYIDYGLSCFNRAVFENYTKGSVIDLADIYSKLIRQNQLAGFEVKERFYEIGSFAGKAEFEKECI